MSRKKELAALETEISQAQIRANELGLSFLAYLLTMAHIELTEASERVMANESNSREMNQIRTTAP